MTEVVAMSIVPSAASFRNEFDDRTARFGYVLRLRDGTRLQFRFCHAARTRRQRRHDFLLEVCVQSLQRDDDALDRHAIHQHGQCLAGQLDQILELEDHLADRLCILGPDSGKVGQAFRGFRLLKVAQDARERDVLVGRALVDREELAVDRLLQRLDDGRLHRPQAERPAQQLVTLGEGEKLENTRCPLGAEPVQQIGRNLRVLPRQERIKHVIGQPRKSRPDVLALVGEPRAIEGRTIFRDSAADQPLQVFRPADERQSLADLAVELLDDRLELGRAQRRHHLGRAHDDIEFFGIKISAAGCRPCPCRARAATVRPFQVRSAFCVFRRLPSLRPRPGPKPIVRPASGRRPE